MLPRLERSFIHSLLKVRDERFGRAACLAGAASLILVGCHPGRTPTPQEAEGKHLYEVRCAHCHEDNDLALKKVPPNLRGLFEQGGLHNGPEGKEAEVKRLILTGKGMMPGFAGRFSDTELSALVAYLHHGLR